MAASQAEFRAPTDGGELAGWLRPGPADKPPMLLLHGGPGLSYYLDSLADELDGLAQIGGYQQRGIAPSTVEGDRSVEIHVRDAVAVMDALGWRKPLVVGHSWGGHLALHIAAAHPDRVGGLVILDALGPVGDGGWEVFGKALQAGLSEEAVARIEELDARDRLTPDERRERLGILWPNYFGEPTNAPPMPAFSLDMRSVETWDSISAHLAAGTLERGLPKVDAPSLVIHGDRSPMPMEQAEHIARLLPNSRLARQGGKGHWAWLEEPGFVRSEVERFLASI